jgi:hypothetical protein
MRESFVPVNVAWLLLCLSTASAYHVAGAMLVRAEEATAVLNMLIPSARWRRKI